MTQSLPFFVLWLPSALIELSVCVQQNTALPWAVVLIAARGLCNTRLA
jgi:hypothetical protein